MAKHSLAIVPATETRILRSTLAHDSYVISVALPFHYDEKPHQRWPVIYGLDGNMHFNMVADMVWEGLTAEDLDGPKALVDRLADRDYADFAMTQETLVSTHCAMVPLAYQSGLVQVLTQ